MHVAVVVENIPNPATGGGAITGWTVIKLLVERGHRVTACLLLEPSALKDPSEEARMTALAELGTEVMPVPVRYFQPSAIAKPGKWQSRLAALHSILRPGLSQYYPWVSMAPEMESLIKRIQPDAVFTYHWKATAAMYGLNHVPRMAALGDPDYVVYRYWAQLPREKEQPRGGSLPLRRRVLSIVKSLVDTHKHPKFMLRLLYGYDALGFFAAHHADWMRKNGMPHCLYLRTPIPDPIGLEWEHVRNVSRSRDKPKLLLIGHLRGTATLSGLYLFARETLPVLEEKLGTDAFEVHIVGGDPPPADLAAALARPSVRLRGHIEPADREFLSSDVLLVPTPIELGIRVRILVGWSFGCAVVAHRANALGIPEMRHEENALLARDGRELADAAMRALGDPMLRKHLGRNGRRTYEQYFAASTAGARIITELERIVQDRSRARATSAVASSESRRAVLGRRG